MLCFPMLFLSASGPAGSPFPPLHRIKGSSPSNTHCGMSGLTQILRPSGQQPLTEVRAGFDSILSAGPQEWREPSFNWNQLILSLLLGISTKATGQGRRSHPYWVKLYKLLSQCSDSLNRENIGMTWSVLFSSSAFAVLAFVLGWPRFHIG